MLRGLVCWFWLTTVYTLCADSPAAVCGTCHRPETARFQASGMAQALVPARDARALRSHNRLTIQMGGYSYEIARSPDRAVYSVTDGKDTIRADVDWVFGKGDAGQTFVFQRDGQWYESRVSYYAALDGLDATMGAQDTAPHNLAEAAGRWMSQVDTTECFGCHATNAVKASELTLSAMKPGVECEACHGPTEPHLRAVRTGQGNAAMRKLGNMSSEEMADFCGRCHRSWSFVAMNGPHGIMNVRFQPYRMALSKCFDPTDTRMRCTACHNPHGEADTSPQAYDSKCMSCHTAASGHVCSVARRDCVTCHMPKIELPGAHRKFTDHRIRIARAGDPYPD